MLRVVEFKQEYVPAEKGEMRTVDFVKLAPSGDAHMKTQTWHRVEKLRPPENMDAAKAQSDTMVAMSARWSVIGPAYEAWKTGVELPETGTPLEAWAGVNPDQVTILKQMAIRTVEDVAATSPEVFAKMPFPNARKLPELAKDYLEGASQAAAAAENAELKERIAAMEEMLAAQTVEKRKPGRPRKEPVEA